MTHISQSRILVIDDSPINGEILKGLFRGLYVVELAGDGETGLQMARRSPPPDLILLDILMAGLDGFEVCARLKGGEPTREIPVLFLTNLGEGADKARGFGLGAVDYIIKPFDPLEVKARVRTHLLLRATTLELRRQNEALEEMVRERTRELVLTQQATLESLACLTEARDPETGHHIKRTKNYVEALARRLRENTKFRDQLDPDTIDLLVKSSTLHDIGKVGVPDHILNKPGSLTTEEMAVMRQHTLYGHRALQLAEKRLGTDNTFLRVARDIAYTHHEKWDGSGYPRGLAGVEIPLSGRLMAVADVYDALISRRVYKGPVSHRQAVRIISQGDGQTSPDHFDPDILDAFLATEGEFLETALQYADSREEFETLVQ